VNRRVVRAPSGISHSALISKGPFRDVGMGWQTAMRPGSPQRSFGILPDDRGIDALELAPCAGASGASHRAFPEAG